MAEQEQNKSEQPTPHKLSEAKKKGQVAKSTEFTGIVGLLLILPFFYALSGWLIDSVANVFRMGLLSVGVMGKSNSDALISWAWHYLTKGGMVVLPILFLAMFAGVLLTLVQTGFIWTSEPLKPDIKRLNPVANLKKLFSKKILFELTKVLIKLSIFIMLAWWFGADIYYATTDFRYMLPDHFASSLSQLLFLTGLVVGVVLLLFALADLAFVKWSFLQQMKMSVREIKDEYKKREGDPELKVKRRKSQQELLKRLVGLSKVKNADVIITNPTHFAVAIRYRPEDMLAPEVLVSGRGIFAALIRKQARRYSILIKQDPPLARLLYRQCRVGGPIVTESFEAVAKIYRVLWREAESEQGKMQ
ncbi:EscU/YscU/HrcU family type III secretion system export apparatus switch protein [Vibrio cincinnatiensis]|uniref:EscU/YscU/HrcU family type III secretion system export apparatus switch protein n=1 Tax=Vibrio cincinnatiensis TaxID=675 RepID=UPI001EDEFFB0|nr:EscU/YscU/HrcU family type III secretion system export apparatus switch protein [Vibrio cincinnatiensis]MCG3723686.1 EscU/YscU/HrcU family type III secretion system export apparatus switch protein [Vibrio cincinnatiensis]